MRLLFSTGGTGGHVYPILALIEEAKSSDIDISVVLGKDKRDWEGLFNDKTYTINVFPFSSRRFKDKIVSIFRLFASFLKALSIVRHVKPDGVVISGSFASFPVLLASIVQRKPYFVLEQNRIPGRVVRLAAFKAKRVFTTFPVGFKNELLTGNPIRKSLLKYAVSKKTNEIVLIIGGSQGASYLNNLAFRLATHFKNRTFLLIKGKWQLNIEDRPGNLLIKDYIDDIGTFYARTHIAIARAGGGVIAELLAFGIPAVYIPFRYAVDNHQYWNAEFVEGMGAGFCVQEGDDNEVILRVNKLFNENVYEDMHKKALSIARPHAAYKIIKEVKKCLEV